MARLTLKRSLVALGAAVACGGALADPVSVLALAISAYSPVAAFVVTVAGGLYQSSQQRRQARRAAARARAEYNAGLTDRTVTLLSSDMPRQIIYGNPGPVPGAVADILTSGDRDEFTHLVVVFACHECEAIDEVYLEGDPIGAVDADGWVTGGAFLETSTDQVAAQSIAFDGSGNATVSNRLISRVLSAGSLEFSSSIGDVSGTWYELSFTTGTTDSTLSGGPANETIQVQYLYQEASARVNLQKHLSPGGVDTADAFLLSRVPTKWTSAHKASGYTYAVITLDKRMARFQGGPPQITASIRGKKLYDPRTTLTAYSANPALVVGDYLTAAEGFGADRATISSADWIASANACDAAAWSASDATANTTALYRCDGVVRTDQDRQQVLDSLADSMAGWCYESGGQWRILSGTWTAPVLTLTDSTCKGGRIEIVQASFSGKDRYNGAKGIYAPWNGAGAAPDFAPYQNSTFRTADGTDKFLDLRLPFVHSTQRAHQVARVKVEQSRGGLLINYPADMSAWHLQPGDRTWVTNTEFGWSAKTFRVTDWAFGLSTPVMLTLIEDESSYYDTADEVSVDAAPNTALPNPRNVASASNLAAYSGTDELLRQGDGTIITRVRVAWDATDSIYVEQSGKVQLQWRNATDQTGWRALAELPGDQTEHRWDNMADGQRIIVRHRFVNQLGIPSAWAYVTHDVLGKSELPSDVEWVLYSGGVLTWATVSDADCAGYVWRYVAGANVNWSAGLPLHDGLVLRTPWAPDALPVGTVTLMVKARDTSGNESATPAYVVIELGDAVTGNILESWPQATTFADGTITDGTVNAGVLEADDGSDLFWLDGDALVWAPPDELMWTPPTYKQMTYEVDIAPTSAGVLTLVTDIEGDDVRIEYRRGDMSLVWSPGTDYAWSPGADAFWGAPSDWKPWPSTLSVLKDEAVSLRITTGAGSTQGRIITFTPTLDVPDIEETLEDVAIDAAGTRLTLVNSYSVIKNVQLTVQSDGGTGITARVEDKSAALGPLIKVLDASGTATTGVIDARIQGY